MYRGDACRPSWNCGQFLCAAGGLVLVDPLLELQPHTGTKSDQPDAASLSGLVRPDNLAVGFDRRMLARKGELQMAPVAFDYRAHNLAAQSLFTDIEQDAAGIGSKSDIGQLIEPLARVCATFGRRGCCRRLGGHRHLLRSKCCLRTDGEQRVDYEQSHCQRFLGNY
jgi:hypothetical protein